jgi:serine/threonine protein kinase
VDGLQAWFWFDLQAKATSASGPVLAERDVLSAFGIGAAQWLGTGSFGETWLLDPGGEACAAKVLLDSNYPREYLNREIEGLQRVRSANVVTLREVRDVDLSSEKRTCLLFDYIDGGDLASNLRSGAWPDEQEVFDFAVGLLSGLEALHALDAIHRDIKLENVALQSGAWGQPVVLDLGLVKFLDGDTFTLYPQLVGTCPFMSPEQIRGEQARKGADVWAAGVVLHLLLAGSHPFFEGWDGRLDRSAALERVLAGPNPLPTTVSEPLRSLVPQLLSGKPYERGSAARAIRTLRNGGQGD